VSRQWVIAVEQGKPGAALGLVLRALKALDLPLWLGELPVAVSPHSPSASTPAVDLDAVIDRARGKRR
jgi:HTH-type transcriptional regulator/antitoxin HipB